MADPYEKHGLKRVINAAACLTRLGGSKPDPRVFKAMEEASRAFIQIPVLQKWAGERIAEATGAEAGLPTAGAVNSLVLAAAACMMKGTELGNYDPLGGEKWSHINKKLPLDTEGLRTEFIVQKPNRNSYDYAVSIAGGRMREIEPTREALDMAYDSENTAAYYHTVRGGRGMPLETVIEVAHSHGVPVIVDAAPDLRPKSMLKYYTGMGADLVVFSGGKHLGGPNNSGILAGKADLIKLAHLQAYPFDGIGRAAKVSRETIMGLVEALRIYVERDDDAAFKQWEDQCKVIVEKLEAIPGVEAGLVYETTIDEGLPMTPFAYITVDESETGVSLRELHSRLKEGDIIIETLYEPGFLIKDYKNKITINPEYLLEGDDEIIVTRVKEILG
ncbi:MAG: aminotransferase class V-fold PLP-dependent enzyme [Candidatus Bathyarchaeota archaeon]|nr:aminotransferase class V-fold PLP-dependent enzyme [Candidatus Bathyarchaeota archaeon]